jgi:hypothetical protein
MRLNPFNQYDMPTTCSWVENNHQQALVAYQSNSLDLYDVSRSAAVSSNQLLGGVPSQRSQSNHLECHPTMSLAANAHDNGVISFFDF